MRRENNTFIKFDVVHSMVGGAMSGEPNGPFRFHDGQPPPTESEIDAEVIRLQAEYDALKYARNRKLDYPDIGDQLDALYHAGVFPANMAARIKETKDKYPK